MVSIQRPVRWVLPELTPVGDADFSWIFENERYRLVVITGTNAGNHFARKRGDVDAHRELVAITMSPTRTTKAGL